MCYAVVVGIQSQWLNRLRMLKKHVVVHDRAQAAVEYFARSVGGVWAQGPVCACTFYRGCGCGQYEPIASGPAHENDEQQLTERYRQKGWSDAKIARALAQSRAAMKHKQNLDNTEVSRPGLSESAARFVMQASQSLGDIGLLVYWNTPGELAPLSFGQTIGCDALDSMSSAIRPDQWIRVVSALATE